MSNCIRKLLLLWLAMAAIAQGGLVLPPLFQDHLVLQRNRPVPVWGWADPGSWVSVKFRGETAQTRAAPDGCWDVRLKPLMASSLPEDLVISAGETRTIRDVLVGDVWLCSGQSNMAWSVGASDNPDREVPAAHWPRIRHFKVALTVADKPQTSVSGSWTVCSPATVSLYSAVGYYFARELQRNLDVPIGIITCAFGGSAVEAWLSEEAFAKDESLSAVSRRWTETVAGVTPLQRLDYERARERWKKAVEEAEESRGWLVAPVAPWPPPGPGSFLMPSGLFNGMLHPLLPVELAGVLWYQGEANAIRAKEYASLFRRLITSWREAFQQTELPFYWIQLPGFRAVDTTGESWAWLREAQSAALSLPNTDQVVTIDLGNPQSIHPTNKQAVGRRAAARVIAKALGKQMDEVSFDRAVREGDALRVHFKPAGSELISIRGLLPEFTLAGEDGRFFPAEARLEGETIVVRTKEVPAPCAVRYAWRNAPEVDLFTKQGLPVPPFRSDALPALTE
ncbi:MAG TPA: sialate O-acetylesterase [Opitutaceae bacterium]|nr:sialate O-acetylesterase [Opitutaceae bacterium]